MENIFVSGLSTLLIVAHMLGGILVAHGVRTLLQGLHGQGQSIQGIEDLRTALIILFKPILVAMMAVMVLLTLTYWERSPLSIWIQGIAPLSTFIWVLWGHFTSKEILAGEMFEALVPLGNGDYDQRIINEAQDWAQKNHLLNPKALVRTALKALDDQSSEYNTRVDIDELVSILRETFYELHLALKRFPLAQRLTLADWIFEGERLSEIWSKGLHSIDRGRNCINPYTLLDQKALWKWSSVQPQVLFEAELSAWLHRGVYLLVVRRWQALKNQSNQPETPSQNKVTPLTEVPALWQLMSRKITVPFWLYWGLCSLAMVISHGFYGLFVSALCGILLYWSLNRVFSIRNWRQSLEYLGNLPRERHQYMEAHKIDCLDHIDNQLTVFNEHFNSKPAQSTLELMQLSFTQIAHTHRRPEHTDGALTLCNATLTDATLAAQYICDDFMMWRTEDGLLSMLLSLADTLGSKLGNFDQKLLESVRMWARAEETTDSESLEAQAQKIDQWLSDQLAQAGFFKKTGIIASLELLRSSIHDRLAKEIHARVLPLYQGQVAGETSMLEMGQQSGRKDSSS